MRCARGRAAEGVGVADSLQPCTTADAGARAAAAGRAPALAADQPLQISPTRWPWGRATTPLERSGTTARTLGGAGPHEAPASMAWPPRRRLGGAGPAAAKLAWLGQRRGPRSIARSTGGKRKTQLGDPCAQRIPLSFPRIALVQQCDELSSVPGAQAERSS